MMLKVLAFFFCVCLVGFTNIKTARALTLHGKLEQGGLVIGKVEPDQTVILDGITVPKDKAGTFVLGFERNASPTAALTIVEKDGSKTTQQLVIQKRDWAIQEIDGLPPAKVTPPPSVYAQIKADSAAIRKVRGQISHIALFKSGFIRPVEGIVSSTFGSQRILNGQPKSPHSGQDIAAPTGTPVFAVADGVVSLAHPDMYYTGKSVMIDHGLGLQTVYVHMSRYFVGVGDQVKSGDIIGEVGATGQATGPHLHWGVSWLDRRIDPETALKVLQPAKENNFGFRKHIQ